MAESVMTAAAIPPAIPAADPRKKSRREVPEDIEDESTADCVLLALSDILNRLLISICGTPQAYREATQNATLIYEQYRDMPPYSEIRRNAVGGRSYPLTTLPDLMHPVQTRIRLLVELTLAFTVCRLMFHRRRVTLCACEILFPNCGFLPQISHTCAI